MMQLARNLTDPSDGFLRGVQSVIPGPRPAPMRALLVKSPEISGIVTHTSIDAAEAGRPPRAGTA